MYCCGRCREPVALVASLSKEHGDEGRLDEESAGGKSAKRPCTSLFLEEPLEWMRDGLGFASTSDKSEGDEEEAEASIPSGKLYCPKCKNKIGSFDWAGSKCSCGKWITPAFQIQKNRVDLRKLNATRAGQCRPINASSSQ